MTTLYICGFLLFLVSTCVGKHTSSHDTLFCGDLQFASDVPKGTEYCEQLKPISFHTCQLLLHKSSHCNGMVYSRGRCTLMRRSGSETSHAPSSQSINMIKITPTIDNCIFRSNLSLSGILNFNSADISLDIPSSWYDLPLLGMVMAVTSDWMQANKDEVDAVTSNFNCYANVHGYYFHLHVMPPTPRNKFYHVRHLSVADAYLSKYKYLLVLDADNFVFNLSRPMESVLPPSFPHPSASDPHIFLHMRDGGEVTASTFIIRNSPYSRQFLQWWRDMAPPLHMQSTDPKQWVETPNHDNGDLVALLMTLLDREAYLNCVSYLRSSPLSVPTMVAYDRGPLLCFRMFRGALAEEDKRGARGLAKRLPQVKVFFTRESFFTMHSGYSPVDKRRMTRVASGMYHRGRDLEKVSSYAAGSRTRVSSGSHDVLWSEVLQSNGGSVLYKDSVCAPGDLIGHGMKSIGSVYGVSSATGRDSSLGSCDKDAILRGEGANKKCKWLSLEEELLVAQHYCFWRAKVCRGEQGTNLCIEHPSTFPNRSIPLSSKLKQKGFEAASKCEIERFNMQRWSLCVNHGYCNPLMPYRFFVKNITVAASKGHILPLKLSQPWKMGQGTDHRS